MQKITGNSNVLDKYFSEWVMSLHLKENVPFATKEWNPWSVQVQVDKDKIATKEFLYGLVDDIFAEVEGRDDGFLEIDRKLLKIVQLGPYRIVIVFPPLADWLELTIVRPVFKLSLDDYDLDPTLRHYLENEAKWILISGSPWSGKTTFAQAIIEQHKDNKHITKTIESPRDLLVSDEIVQYSFSYGSHEDIRDILLLSRPDFCVFDEVRNVDDFLLFKDLRLTWIGLLGVIHATRAIDWIQRFLGHVELWIIPQMIDTIVYIEKWSIAEVLNLSLVVKVPHGMESSDLARPVIQVFAFGSQEAVYEIYSFGEQIVVMPLEDVHTTKAQSGMARHALWSIKKELYWMFDFDFLLWSRWNSLTLYVPTKMKSRVIWSWGANIQSLEKSLGMSISVRLFSDLPLLGVQADQEINAKWTRMVLTFPQEMAGRDVALLVGEEILKTRIDNRATINVSGKGKVNSISRKWFVVIDMSDLQ